MILVTRGLVTYEDNGRIRALTPESDPVQLDDATEARLVDRGVATYVNLVDLSEDIEFIEEAPKTRRRSKKEAAPVIEAAGVE